eukprot:m.30230 g.30230  ORF g.30230 m.30230 type:complete len:185 (+) comp6218_c0_seq2:277-831(+)
MLTTRKLVLNEDGFVRDLTNPEKSMEDELIKFFCRTHHEDSLVKSLAKLDLDNSEEVLKATTNLMKTMLALNSKELKGLTPTADSKPPSIRNAISFATALVDAQFANFLTDASHEVVKELLDILEAYNKSCAEAELVDGVLCHLTRSRKGKQQVSDDITANKTVQVIDEKKVSKHYSIETIKLL